MSFVSVIIPAAGSGTRMGEKTPKQFLELGSVPVLVRTIGFFEKLPRIDEIIIVTGKDHLSMVERGIVGDYGFQKVTHIVAGGEKRQDSVYNGLIHCDDRADVIMVHDAARPFPPAPGINAGIDSALEGKGGVLAIPVTDTIKRATGGLISETLNRDELWAVQTPQIFPAEILKTAFEKALRENFYGTDEASLVEYAGFPVSVFPGSSFNIKITVPADLILGEAIVRASETGEITL